MDYGIRLTRRCQDGDLLELRIELADGVTRFASDVYVGRVQLAGVVAELAQFGGRMDGASYSFRFGEFGAEWAGGALDVRMQCRQREGCCA